jgi:GTP cyclohydrolase I
MLEDTFTHLLAAVEPDPTREGLLETPARAAKAWLEWTSGYDINPGTLLKAFKDGAEQCGDELVIVQGIEFYSHCEHHLAPFFGEAAVAYIPDGRVVGLSKLARVVDAFAKRLQVQERLTNQIADCIDRVLLPVGVGVIMKARHMCMCSRGVSKQHSTTITSALRGALREKPEARAEFMALVKP